MEKRYIDADKMWKAIRMKKHITAETKANLYSFIEYNEIADVQEVRHGKWSIGKEPSGSVYAHCSACNRKMNDFCYGYLHCPMCGAQMDGKG